MKASVMDLRYHMKDILRALKRNEKVTIFYHGKEAGILIPPPNKKPWMNVAEHPFFGSGKKKLSKKSMEEIMDEIRGPRYRDL